MNATAVTAASTADVFVLQAAPTVGAVAANTEMLAELIAPAPPGSVVVGGEMDLCGYPVLDLALEPGFVAAATQAAFDLAEMIDPTVTAVIGCVFDAAHRLVADRVDTSVVIDTGARIAVNVAAVLHGGTVIAAIPKRLLPTYETFDEVRTFLPGRLPAAADVLEIGGRNVGICVCEDVWSDQVPAAWAAAGADTLFVLNASPFHAGKQHLRRSVVADAARRGLDVVWVNRAGATDELCFDGGSIVATAAGTLTELPRFTPGLFPASFDAAASQLAEIDENEELWSAVVTATRSYLEANGFDHVVLGASGGIDSAVVAAVAADALGPDRVTTVAMPGPYSSQHSLDDAADLAARIGCEHHVVPIGPIFDAFATQLGVAAVAGDPRPLAGTSFDVTEENLQARARGAVLMAISNKGVTRDGQWRRTLTLTTSNRTESAVGYFTMYGDAAGGYAPIRDIAKTKVFELARWRNKGRPQIAHRAAPDAPIPPASISKPPSAELAPGQLDSDALPPYPLLDRILELLVPGRRNPSDVADEISAEAADCGLDPDAIVGRVARLVRISEFKRRQTPPGPRVTPLAFGTDRHVPVTPGWNPPVSRP